MASLSVSGHPLYFRTPFPSSQVFQTRQTKFFLPLRAEGGKVRSQGAALDSSAMLRRPVVAPHSPEEIGEVSAPADEAVAERERDREVVVAEEERGKRGRRGRPKEWVDWEDMILEDTVPLVGFVRMILHSAKYENGDRLSAEHETAILERLLPYHPEYKEKIGCGVDFIMVGLHPEFENSRCLFIVRKDGELVDFSFWKCIKGLIRKKYPLYADSFILRHFRRRRNPLADS